MNMGFENKEQWTESTLCSGLKCRIDNMARVDVKLADMFVGKAVMPSDITFMGLGADGINDILTANVDWKCYNRRKEK